jgi:hypothetical protein
MGTEGRKSDPDGEMPRGSFACFLAAAAVFAGGCSTPLGSGKASTEEIEQALAESDFHAADAKCEEVTGGWDYVCHFADPRGGRWKIGVLVEGRRLTRSSAPVAETAVLAAPRAIANEGYEDWLDRVSALCRQVNVEMKALPTPRSSAEFETYIDSVQRIGVRYSARLAALPPPPKLIDRETYGRLLLMMGEDNRQAGELRKAVHDRDRAAVDRLLRDLAYRNSAENELFNSLGGDC